MFPAVYPPPPEIISIEVISPAPALGEAELLSDEEIDVEIETDVDGESDADGEEETDLEGDDDADGEDDTEEEGDEDAEVDGDTDDERDIELEGEEDADDDGEDDAEAETEEDGELETLDERELLSTTSTLNVARASASPTSPATRVTMSPTAYPVPLLISCHVTIESIAPSNTSKTDVAAAPARPTVFMTVFRIGRKKLFVAEMGSDFAI